MQTILWKLLGLDITFTSFTRENIPNNWFVKHAFFCLVLAACWPTTAQTCPKHRAPIKDPKVSFMLLTWEWPLWKWILKTGWTVEELFHEDSLLYTKNRQKMDPYLQIHCSIIHHFCINTQFKKIMQTFLQVALFQKVFIQNSFRFLPLLIFIYKNDAFKYQ